MNLHKQLEHIFKTAADETSPVPSDFDNQYEFKAPKPYSKDMTPEQIVDNATRGFVDNKTYTNMSEKDHREGLGYKDPSISDYTSDVNFDVMQWIEDNIKGIGTGAGIGGLAPLLLGANNKTAMLLSLLGGLAGGTIQDYNQYADDRTALGSKLDKSLDNKQRQELDDNRRERGNRVYGWDEPGYRGKGEDGWDRSTDRKVRRKLKNIFMDNISDAGRNISDHGGVGGKR